MNRRRAGTAFAANGRPTHSKRRSRNRPPGSAPTTSGAAAAWPRTQPLPPAWEPETLVDAGDAAAAEAAELRSRPWNKEDERALRGRIRDTMSKIADISGGLQDTSGNNEAGGQTGGAGERGRGGGAGSVPATRGRRTKSSQADVAANPAGGEASIKSLHESLKISLELAATGEKHASANTTAIADMSDWLTNLERKQLVGPDEAVHRNGGNILQLRFGHESVNLTRAQMCALPGTSHIRGVLMSSGALRTERVWPDGLIAIEHS